MDLTNKISFYRLCYPSSLSTRQKVVMELRVYREKTFSKPLSESHSFNKMTLQNIFVVISGGHSVPRLHRISNNPCNVPSFTFSCTSGRFESCNISYRTYTYKTYVQVLRSSIPRRTYRTNCTLIFVRFSSSRHVCNTMYTSTIEFSFPSLCFKDILCF